MLHPHTKSHIKEGNSGSRGNTRQGQFSGVYLLTSLPGGDVRQRGWDLLLIQQRFPGSAGGASPEQGWGKDRREAVLADKRKISSAAVDTLLGRRPDKSHTHPWQEPAQLLPPAPQQHRKFSLRHDLSPQPWLWHLSVSHHTPLPVSWPFVGLFKAWGTFCITGNLGSEQLAW